MSEGCKNYVSWEAAIRIWWGQLWRGLIVMIIMSVILGFIPALAVIKPLANWLISIWARRASLVDCLASAGNGKNVLSLR
jgi:hypothetical protein